jgi:1-acyl-sn-glycerol-3-phosphate acyltransferase
VTQRKKSGSPARTHGKNASKRVSGRPNKLQDSTRSEGRSAQRAAPRISEKRRKKGPVAETAPLLVEPPRRKAPSPRETPVEEPSQAPDDSRFSDPYPINHMDVDMLGIGSPVFPPDGFQLTVPEDEESSVGVGAPWADDPSVEVRIREIEERLDGLLASQPQEGLDPISPPQTEVIAPTPADTAVDAAREVLESEYYRRKWGRTSLRAHTNEVDDFGMDPDFEEKLRPALDFLFKKYFRVEVEGLGHVPASGRAVVVANHSGALPFDGVMLREAIRQRHSGRNDLRWLAEDFSFYLPFLGVTLNRLGAVRACPENAERLLEKEHLVGVFPEGAEGIKKLYKERYQLQRFGRGGFVRLCLKTGSPIIPCAIVGAEETNPVLYRFDNLSKLLGLDYLPITPTFPWFGPLGLLPAPTKWRIIFGEPISVAEFGPQAAQDHVLIGRLAERVRGAIKDLLDTALRRRKSIWL